jgi:preprotein translocase subunit SecE
VTETAPNSSLAQRVTQWPAQTRTYVEGLREEMRRVTWPSWKQVRATTIVVIVAVFAFAAYFYLVDIVFGQMITRVFDTFTK